MHGAEEEEEAARPAVGVWTTPPDALGKSKVMHGDKHIGTISVIRVGFRDESLSVYCKLHQCNICRMAYQAPTYAEICRWFERGLEREGKHRSWHKPLFDEMFPKRPV